MGWIYGGCEIGGMSGGRKAFFPGMFRNLRELFYKTVTTLLNCFEKVWQPCRIFLQKFDKFI